MDIKSFLKIIYSENENYAYNPRLFQLRDQNETRKEKIDNLIDKLDIYHHAFHERHRSSENIITEPDMLAKNNKWNTSKPKRYVIENREFNKQ